MNIDQSNPDTGSTEPKRDRRRLLLVGAVGLAAGLLMGWLLVGLLMGDFGFGEPQYQGIVMPTAEPLADFTLTAHTGDRVSLSDFQDQVVLIYFGYTHCPDACPLTLAHLARAFDGLKPEERDDVQVLMITVDPERDTPELLAGYVVHFDPSFLGLTGSTTEIAQAAEMVGIFYQKAQGGSDTDYLMDHTASVTAIDKEGRVRLIYPFDTAGDEIGSDLRNLLKE